MVLRRVVSVVLPLYASGVAAMDPRGLEEPIPVSNRNPLVAVHGVPAAFGAKLLAPDESVLGLQVEVANSFSISHQEAESIELDGESYRVVVNWRTGLGSGFELGLELPWFAHRGGELDSAIENWHQLWNLPDGNRDSRPRDRLHYAYRDETGPLLDMDSGQDGLGDTRAQLGYQLAADDHHWLAVRLHAGLATGDADKLTGSGGNSIGVSFHASRRGLFSNPRWYLHGSMGALWLDKPKVLEPVVEDVAGHGSVTIAWLASPDFSVKLQLDGHTPLYDSTLSETGDRACQLLFGGSLRLAPDLVLDAWLSEDIAVDTSPDVVFGIALRYRP